MSVDKKPIIKMLSQGVLDLKFMKKSKEKAKIQEENEERQILYKDQLDALPNSANTIVQISSYYDVMEYLPCRLSFGGMEPSIEKMNLSLKKLKGLYKVLEPQNVKEEEEEAEISKEEMAEYYSSIKETLARKLNKRYGSQRSNPPQKRHKSSEFEEPEN